VRTNEELREMAGHVAYEVEQFRESVAECATLMTTGRVLNRNQWNRALESALLHFRILRGFFIDTPTGKDASARDYVSTWSPNANPIFDKTRVALNRRLSHLSWDRVPSTAQNWDLAAMKDAVERLFEEFKKALVAPASEWFTQPAAVIVPGLSDCDGNSTVSGPSAMLFSQQRRK
jgi:hypothetical protein